MPRETSGSAAVAVLVAGNRLKVLHNIHTHCQLWSAMKVECCSSFCREQETRKSPGTTFWIFLSLSRAVHCNAYPQDGGLLFQRLVQFLQTELWSCSIKEFSGTIHFPFIELYLLLPLYSNDTQRLMWLHCLCITGFLPEHFMRTIPPWGLLS